MTCIAWDGRTLAADSMTTAMDIHVWNSEKIERINGALVATAGRTEDGILFSQWFKAGCPGDQKPVLDADAFQALVVTRHGAFMYFEKLIPIPVQPPVAIGCGFTLALAAMKAGASATRAVEIACELDIHCGPPVISRRFSK